MRKHLRKLVWGIFLLTPILLHPVYLTAQTTVSGSGGGGGITIDSTAISGGATTQVLYNAAGVVSSDSGFTRGSGTTGISNGAAAVSPLIVYDNVTPVFTIADGGAVTATSTLQAAGLTSTSSIQLATNSNLYLKSSASYDGGTIRNYSNQTPNAPVLATGSVSNSWQIFEFLDGGSDLQNGACGTAACTDPGLIIHSAVADTTQYNHLSAWGQAGGALKALTAGAATALVRIPVATNSRASGELVYEIYATDGTDMQVRSSRIRYAMTNKAGTEACTLTASDGAAANAETNDDNAAQITAGTLTYGIACTNNAADTMDITFNAVSSLVETTLSAKWSVVHLSPGQPARQ